jgi:hypothetical protein
MHHVRLLVLYKLPPQICSNDKKTYNGIVFAPNHVFPTHFLPLIFVCQGIVHWRCMVGTYRQCEICIRCICLRSTKLPPQICSYDPNSRQYCICPKPCLPHLYLLVILVCQGIVHWRRAVGTYQQCEICIRCVCLCSTNCSLRFVPMTKTHGDTIFLSNHVSPTHFCR